MYNTRNAAREERNRQVLESGLMSERFPGVSSIVVTMNYKRERTSSVLWTMYYYPASHAFFRVSCLGEGCDDGGFDLSRVIHRMVRTQERSATGELSCENRDPAVDHAGLDYHVFITYA